MKVALVHYRLLHVGGLETRLLNYANWFAARGDEVHIFTYQVGPEIALPANVIVHCLSVRWVPKIFRPLYFDKLVNSELGKQTFDFVLSLGRTSIHHALIVAGTHHGFLKRMGKSARTISDWVQLHQEKKSFAGTGRLFPSSQSIAEELHSLYKVDPKRIRVLYPPIDTEKFTSALKGKKQFFRQKYRLPSDKLIFLFVSSNHKLKGLPLLESVFSRMKNEKVLLAVCGPGKVDAKTGLIQPLGHITATEELYAAADFLVLASSYESFGQVVAESLLCGTPVIVSNRVGASVIVGKTEGVVVNSLEPNDWEKAIRSCMSGSFEIDDQLSQRFSLSTKAHMQIMLSESGLV